jgi:arylsulfatase A-like enzyme
VPTVVSRRGSTRVVAAFALVLSSACSPEPPSPPPKSKPPVVLVVLDAASAAHVSHLGYERCTTPNLDRLAARGLTCRRAEAPAPYTLASISSLLTAKLPDRHGVVQRKRVLKPEETTIAEVLHANGWRTLAAVSNFNGSSHYGCAQGFDQFIEVFHADETRAASFEIGGQEFHTVRGSDFPPIVERWLAIPDARPTFFYLHVLEPHEPYDPPSCFRELWIDPEYAGPFAHGDSGALAAARDGELAVRAEDREAVRALYDANLAYADWTLGEILERLRAGGIDGEALVIVIGDHGEAFWEHGEQGHNTTLFDEMLRVPLVVKFPDSWRRAPQVIDRTVSPMDLLPSLCQWLDLPVPAGVEWDGVPLDESSAAFGEDQRRIVVRTNEAHPDYGLLEGLWKTIVVRDTGSAPRVRAYDLARDPGEQQPFDGATDPRSKRHATLLIEYASGRLTSSALEGRDLTHSEKSLLEGLGYTE